MAHTICLPYGRGGLTIDLSMFMARCTMIAGEPPQRSTLTAADLCRSFDHPIQARPLRELIRPDDSLCVVTSDGTRPYKPMRFVLHTLFDYLGFVPMRTTVVTGSGSHVPHTKAELDEIFCRSLASRMTIVSHDSRADDLIRVGIFADGTPVTMNRRYVEADKRIVLGHIEPHFFAGYTGGAKGIAPAICGLETIHRIHSFAAVDDRSSAYGDIEGNLSSSLMREAAALAPPDFLINCILDQEQNPMAVFAGHYIEAHRAGVRQARQWSEVAVDRRFPIVVTSNAGHPLDQNLYQAVKGMEAALQIVATGGTIVMASECARGVPPGSRFEELLTCPMTNEALLAHLANDSGVIDDRWQVQRLLQILAAGRIILVSNLGREVTERCRLEYAATVEEALTRLVDQASSQTEIAILPHGPLIIPHVKR